MKYFRPAAKHLTLMTTISRSTLLIILSVSIPARITAQVFKEGQHALSFGYGAGTLIGALNATFDTYADLSTSTLGPLYGKYEYGITENIGLGVNFAYGTNQWSYRYSSVDAVGNPTTYTETTDRTHFSVLARINFHFGNEEKFDPYVGLGMGYRDATWSTNSQDPLGGSGVVFRGLVPLGLEMTIGARYFFSPNIGLYAEVGAAKSVVQGGLIVKF